ncbi:cytochrome d ubiquinol oxidase [Vibrio ishigakensis]|uniref:Z-ring associated protein G n=1 Tax=Vibrio ishigakensis TaxID=1481914 RepID=A0A0B8PDD9_9VIBR|nr:cytochrome d ubiquinol oxidase [Vibrio ishigakensis]GAM67750.1 cytochrome d ubiquinol oxidase subunit III [Vibrio sp. JCM 19236]
MPWIYAIIGLFAGIIIGIIISRITTPQYQKQKELQKELETSKFELEQQRQDLNDHFSETANMLDNLGKEYRKLYEHMAKTSNDLLPNLPEQDNPFAKRIEAKQDDTSKPDADAQPKDYANGATGMLKEEEKVILKAPEAVKAT